MGIRRLENNELWGLSLKSGGEPVADLVAKAHADDPSAVEIKNLWLDPRCRGLGFGRVILDVACREFPAIWPGRTKVVADAKLGSPVERFALRNGFNRQAVVMKQGPFGHNKEWDALLERPLAKPSEILFD